MTFQRLLLSMVRDFKVESTYQIGFELLEEGILSYL
jgi:hypothetical protein